MPTYRMSSRERMLAALRRQGPDHVPFSPYVTQGPYYRPPLLWRHQFERAERELELGLDPAIDVWMPDHQPHPDVRIRTRRTADGDGHVIAKEYHTPAGVLRSAVREGGSDWFTDPLHGPWIPTTMGTERAAGYGMDLFNDWNVSRRLEPWVKGREDLAKLRYLIRAPEDYVLDEWRMDAARAIEFAHSRGLLTLGRRPIVGDAFQWFCDIPWFIMQMVDDPPFVTEFLDIFQQWAKRLTELFLEAGVDAVQYRGWYEIPTYWGVTYWDRYLVPLIEEQTRMVHAAGKLHVYLLPEGQGAFADVLRTMSFDTIHGLDPRMLHGGDLKTLFAKLGKDKSFWGGLNAEVTIQSCDRAAIRREMQESVDICGANGGLVLGSFLFPTCPHEGIMMAIDAWRDCCL